MSYTLMFEQANALYADGAFTQAERLYRQILQTNPQNPDVLNMLGLVAHAQGLFEQATECFYKALQITPSHQPLYFNLAVSLQALHKFTEAKNAYLKLIELNPNIKEAFNNLGGVYECLHNTMEAEKCYLKALALDANYLEAEVNLLVLKNDVSALEQLTLKYPEQALPYYYLALMNFNKSLFDKAQEFIDQALQYDATSFEIFLLAGEIALKTNRKSQAAAYFEKALGLNKYCSSAMINLAVLEQDEDLFKQALNLEPNNAETHAGYAALLYAQKRTVEALEEYRKAVIINPSMPEISNNLALILKDMGEYEQALDLLLNAFKLNPKEVDFSVNLAETLTLFYEQSPERALQIAGQWKNFAPDNVFALHIFSAFSQQKSPQLSQYAEALFDEFAQTYDNTMSSINYGVIDKIKTIIPEFTGRILDLGCGTGLAAIAFKTQNNEFVGVDISQKMLDIAASRKLYAQLIKSDILDFLQGNKLKYNFIMSLDVFEYIENISDVINLCYPINFLFTTENAPQGVTDCKLASTGRYQHNPDYVLNLLKNAGYQNISHRQLVLRQENGKDVLGTLFVAQLSIDKTVQKL